MSRDDLILGRLRAAVRRADWDAFEQAEDELLDCYAKGIPLIRDAEAKLPPSVLQALEECRAAMLAR